MLTTFSFEVALLIMSTLLHDYSPLLWINRYKLIVISPVVNNMDQTSEISFIYNQKLVRCIVYLN